MFQWNAYSWFFLVVLGKHQVPYFKKAVAVAFSYAAVRSAGHVFALVYVNFRARTAGAGIAHGPEVVFFAHAKNAVGRQPRHFLPQPEGFFVVAVYGDIKLVLRQAQFFSDELPCKADGFSFKIGCKGKVAQHFEKGVVPCRAPDIFQVVVLAAYAQAFLRSGRAIVRAFFLSEIELFKLYHAGVREKQAWIVPRHEGR